MWKKLMSLYKTIVTPVDLNGWASNILVAIPRIIGGLLLTIDFGSSKFGMPWTDSEKNLSLFQVALLVPRRCGKVWNTIQHCTCIFCMDGSRK